MKNCERMTEIYKVLFFSVIASRLCEMILIVKASRYQRMCERTFNVLLHRRDAIKRCGNAINGKIRTLSIPMIYSHCTHNAEVRTKY